MDNLAPGGLPSPTDTGQCLVTRKPAKSITRGEHAGRSTRQIQDLSLQRAEGQFHALKSGVENIL